MHTVKFGIPEYDDELFYDSYYGTGLNMCYTYGMDRHTDLDIYITSFDGLLYATYQIKMFRKLFADVDFTLIFCDTNSHVNPVVSEKTKELCIANNVGYVKMPHNKFQDMESFSFKLGTDLNWIYYNCVSIRKPKYFGLIDQDCFVIKPCWDYIRNFLDMHGMYGLAWPQDNVKIDSKYWLIHIMNNFFRYDFVMDVELDFRPASFVGLDTSGCNFFSLFKHHDRLTYVQTESQLTEYVGHQWDSVFREFSLHDDGRWVHIKNSTKPFTNDANERAYKEVYMTGILDGILLSNI